MCLHLCRRGGASMVRKEDFMSIKSLHGRGVYQKDIALELGVHPKTVGRALKRGSAPRGLRRRGRGQAGAFKSTVDRLLGEGGWDAGGILRGIQAEGYL